MKSSALLLATGALLATATPLDRRDLVVKVVTQVTTTTVTVDYEPTPTPELPVAVPMPEVLASSSSSSTTHSPAPAPKSSSSSPPPVSPSSPAPVVPFIPPSPSAPVVSSTPPPPPPPPPSTTARPTTTSSPAPKPTLVVVPSPSPTPAKPSSSSKLVAAPSHLLKPIGAQIVRPAPSSSSSTPPAAQPTPAPPPPPAAAAPVASTSGGSYQDVMIQHHNIHRANHTASPVVWDETLAQYATNLAQRCRFAHDLSQGDGIYGQNMAIWGSTADLSGQETLYGSVAVTNQWYDDELNEFSGYGLANPPSSVSFEATGHFTQIVWASTTKIGCATYHCPAGTAMGYPSMLTFCNYAPPGNYGGQYAQNVLPPLGHPNIRVSV